MEAEKKPRRRLYNPGDETEIVRITLPSDMIEKLRTVAKRSCLEPSVYVRTLLATHLNKFKSP